MRAGTDQKGDSALKEKRQISRHTEEINHYDLTLVSYGMGGHLSAGHIYGPVLERHYLLQYCASGCGVLEADGRPIPVSKGQCIVTFPGQIRLEKADRKHPWELMWIALNGESAVYFLEKLGVTPQNPLITYWGASQIPISLQEIIETADAMGFQRSFLLGAKMMEFFDKCLKVKEALGGDSTYKRARDSYVEQALYYLNVHYTQKDITIEGLAEHLNLNRSYLYEIFKEKTGLSPQEYLSKQRILKSCEYLKLPQASVTSVAHALGYELSVFSKAFKQAMGMTPSEYRQLHMQEAPEEPDGF